MTLEWLVQTDGSVGALILRLTLAVVLFPHGAQKVLGGLAAPASSPPCSPSAALAFRQCSGYWRSPRSSSARSASP